MQRLALAPGEAASALRGAVLRAAAPPPALASGCSTSKYCVTAAAAPLAARRQLQQPRRPDVCTAAKKGGKGGGGGGGGGDAPAKSKGKAGGSKDAGAVDGDAIEKEAKADAEVRMKKGVQVLADGLNTLRTGRANPGILDRIMVDSYGAPTPLKSLATVTVPDSTTLQINPFDPASIKEIERAINESDLGLTPNNDGACIRLGLPQLTQERRKDLVKQVGKYGEDAKVAVRNVRKDVMKQIEKYGDAFGKDAKKSLENEIQKLTDVYCKRVEEMCKTKSDELMKV